MTFFYSVMGPILLLLHSYTVPLAEDNNSQVLTLPYDLASLPQDDKLEALDIFGMQLSDIYDYDSSIAELASDGTHFWIHFYCDVYKNGEYAGADESYIDAFTLVPYGIQFNNDEPPGCLRSLSYQ